MKSVQASQPGKAKISQGVLMSALMGVLGGMIISVLMLCIFSAVITSRNNSQSALMPMACISIAAGAFFGGFFASRVYRNKGLLIGTLTGVLLFVFLYITGAIMRQIDLGTLALLKFVISVLAGGVGGIAGVNLGHRKSR